MGIKGKRRKERLRAQREAEEGPAMYDDAGADDFADRELRDLASAQQLPDGIVPASKMKLKHSELYTMQDRDYLEAAEEERANRKGKQPRPRKAARSEQAELAATADANEVFEDGEYADGADAARGNHLDRRSKAAGGPAFANPLVGLDEPLADALAMAGFTNMTPIQARAVPLALQEFDILGQAKTGSGKTLAFAVPVLQGAIRALAAPGVAPGTFTALVMSPTKELCAQIRNVFAEVCSFLRFGAKNQQSVTCELITGGTKVSEERKRLLACNIAIGTPGRLLDHVQHTPAWTIRRTLTHFVMDEADRLLADGFQRDLDGILQALPAARQTLLFSATNSKSVRELARLSLAKTAVFVATKGDAPQALDGSGIAPPYVDLSNAGAVQLPTADGEEVAEAGADDGDEEAIPSTLRQYCQVVPTYDRLMALYAFLKRVAKKRKAMIFCATVASAQFTCMMMGAAGFHNEVLMLHGKMKHRQRLATFEAFQKWDNGVLFCTDVAARGLDIPRVDWILQYDPPTDPTEYIHRIGRTARAGAVGSALMFLTPQEQPFVPYLAKYGIKLDVLPQEPLPDLHLSMQRILELDPIVAQHATNAFRAYVNAYQSHVLTAIFDVRKLHLEDLAISFALKTVPTVSLPAHANAEEKRNEYVKGKLKSIRSRQFQARAEYERLKTKKQWGEDGAFVGMKRPDAEM